MALSLGSAAAAAQEAPQTAQQSGRSSDGRVLEEIIVTTRKREESLQDVPMAITAFTEKDLEDAGIERIEDIALLTPGFNMAPLFGGSGQTPVIRGMMTTIGEPNVGFFVDGVYQSSRATMEALIENVARVEIAKGPQSALYGRNTFGGAVNYITKDPSNNFEGFFEGTLGSDERRDFKGSISGPLIRDKVFFSAGAVHHERDGYFKNELTGSGLDSRNTEVYHGTLEAFLTDTFSITARIAFENTNDGDEPLQFVTNNAQLFNPLPFPAPPTNQLFVGKMPGFESGFAVTPGETDRENLTTSFTMDWDVGPYTLTAITGFNSLDLHTAIDDDYQARQIHFETTDVDQEEFSQEIRLSSPGDGRFRWMLGGYYYHLDADTRIDDRFVGDAGPLMLAVLGPFQSLISDTEEETDSIAAFGQVDLDITSALTFSFAGRYTHEEKDVTAVDTDPIAGISNPPFVDSLSFDNFTPRLSLDYHLTDENLLYFSAARAVKVGGFNVVTAAGQILPEERSFDPERSWHYELGSKTSWFGGRLTANLNGFLIKWNDQIVRALGQTFAVLNINAGKTTSKGIELEVAARPIPGLDIRGGFAYTDAEYDDFDFTTLLLAGITDTQLAGTQLQYAPSYMANGTVQYRRPLMGEIDIMGRADIAYQSKQNAVQTGDAFTADAILLNLRAGFEMGQHALIFWVDNLTDEESAANGVFITNPGRRFDFAAGAAGLGPATGFEAFGGLALSRAPRSWGVTLRSRF